MYIKSSSSGDYSGDVDSPQLTGILTGSGNMRLGGIADYCEFKTSGSGDIDASAMVVDAASCSGTGSGDISLPRETQILRSEFSGSGDLILP